MNKLNSPLEDILNLTKDMPVTQKHIKDLIMIYTYAQRNFDAINRMSALQTLANINPSYLADRRDHALKTTQEYMNLNSGTWK